jgi:hypothetical protein
MMFRIGIDPLSCSKKTRHKYAYSGSFLEVH